MGPGQSVRAPRSQNFCQSSLGIVRVQRLRPYPGFPWARAPCGFCRTEEVETLFSKGEITKVWWERGCGATHSPRFLVSAPRRGGLALASSESTSDHQLVTIKVNELLARSLQYWWAGGNRESRATRVARCRESIEDREQPVLLSASAQLRAGCATYADAGTMCIVLWYVSSGGSRRVGLLGCWVVGFANLGLGTADPLSFFSVRVLFSPPTLRNLSDDVREHNEEDGRGGHRVVR